jgi:hypothetical protein
MTKKGGVTQKHQVLRWRIKKFDTAVKGRKLINIKSQKCLWRNQRLCHLFIRDFLSTEWGSIKLPRTRRTNVKRWDKSLGRGKSE